MQTHKLMVNIAHTNRVPTLFDQSISLFFPGVYNNFKNKIQIQINESLINWFCVPIWPIHLNKLIQNTDSLTLLHKK